MYVFELAHLFEIRHGVFGLDFVASALSGAISSTNMHALQRLKDLGPDDSAETLEPPIGLITLKHFERKASEKWI
ncbi:hypothetical protein [Pseudomonas veronii]|uniref:hypothetical protein n=1 Tax=Pseudomonas veronii TaxID=76761 RepID=UPI0023E044CF|nr:hypothetical protein [Pseudomonas veronii]MDF3237782.1 hypothetical protein [Pseudomonas veronii]